MKRLARSASAVLAVALSIGSASAVAQAPRIDLSVIAFFPNGMVPLIDVTGPPGSVYTTYLYFGGIFFDPFDPVLLYPLNSGVVGPSGHGYFQTPLWIPGVWIPEMTMAAVVEPPAAPPVVTELLQLTLTGGAPPPPAPPPCPPAVGVLSYDPTTCIVTLSAKVCPGQVVEIKINGVVVATQIGPTSGQVAYGGVHCGAATDVITVEVDGAPFLGPLRRC